MDMYGMRLGPAGAEQAVHSWSALPDPHNDEQILPGLQELLGGHSTSYSERGGYGNPDHTFLGPLPLQSNLLPLGQNASFQGFRGDSSLSATELASLPPIPEPRPRERIVAPEPQGGSSVGQESHDSVKQPSPAGSSDSKEHLTLRQADATPACVLDKKILAKQRYREKNRKAQARHRERNKKSIEDLTAKVSALTTENSRLKLEMAITTTLARAKDEHYSKLRRAKENLAYVEAESLIAESYHVANGCDGEPPAEVLEKWCMRDSAAIREANVKKMAIFLSDESTVGDMTSEEFQKFHSQMSRKRQLSLRFAVGKPRFVRSLYAWEREYCKRMDPPDVETLTRGAVRAMGLDDEQRKQMVHARAQLITKMQTILSERRTLSAAAQAGEMEGVADVLTSSLEEERQAVFGLLFTFFDETLSPLQECHCDVALYPWAPDVLAIADVLMEEAVAASPAAIEGLNIPPQLLPTRDGRPNFDALLAPARTALPPCEAAATAEVAAAAGVAWPPETPFQLLSTPVTTCSCGTSGIAILRNVLMFDQGVVPVTLPNVPQEVLIRTPILKMIRQQPALVEG